MCSGNKAFALCSLAFAFGGCKALPQRKSQDEDPPSVALDFAKDKISFERLPMLTSTLVLSTRSGRALPSAAELKRWWETAVPLQASDPSLAAWSYAPWFGGTFATPEGEYSFEIFFGGRGCLTTPKNETGYFQLTLPPEQTR
jgi:hypothetical protein